MFEKIKLKQLNDHIWLMNDQDGATGYIVEGKDRAAVIDTTYGAENIRAVAESVTDRPLTVINTHGHPDHIWGNVWFDRAYMHPADRLIAQDVCRNPDFYRLCEENDVSMPPFEDINEGDIIDLGGLTLEVIALGGHSPGSICLLLREERILFTGDAVNRGTWLHLNGGLPLRQVLENMDRISGVTARADRILQGHGRDFEDILIFDRMREGLREVCGQKGTEITDSDPVYEWFGGKAIKHVYAPHSYFVYTREKLEANLEPVSPENK